MRDDTRKGRRRNLQDASDREGREDAATATAKATRIARPAGHGRKSKAYDAARAETEANIVTATKTATAELVSLDAAEVRYAEALTAYEALLDVDPPTDKASKADQTAALARAKERLELRRRALYDTRHTAATRGALAMLLVKSAKVGHDAKLNDRVGRVGVKGIERAAADMLGASKAPMAN